MDVHVRGIDPEVWRALRIEAVTRSISVARLIEMLWQQCDLKPRLLAPEDQLLSAGVPRH